MYSLKPAQVSWSKKEVSAWSPHHQTQQTYLTWGSDAPFRGLWDVFGYAEKAFPNLDFLVDSVSQKRLTFAQAFDQARSVMHALTTEMGLVPGDRVVVVGRNSLEWCVAFIAASWAGMIAVPMNSWWTGPEMEYGILDSQAAVVFIDDERMQRVLPRMDMLSKVKFVRMERTKEQAQSEFELLANKHAPFVGTVSTSQPRSLTVDSACMIMYTSGTTGHPKGVVLTHRSMCHTLNFYAGAGALSDAKRGEKEVSQKSVLLSVPLFHATGLVAVFLASFHPGRKIVLMRKWQVDTALQIIQKERITQITGVPTMIIQLLNSPRIKEFDLSSLRNVGGGGAAMPAGVAKSIVKTFAKASPGQGYGLTETSAVSTVIGAVDYLNHPTSCGKPVPGVQIEIWPEEGGRGNLPVGTPGRVMIRGANLMREYWRQPEATAKAITVDGWFDSGDIGKLDAEGFLYITDRAKDMIIRGGENISCRAVEEAVYAQVSEVAECAVFGYPDPELGEKVALAVQLKPGAPRLSLDTVRAKCRDALAGYELPTALSIFKTQLPRGATGKLLKKALREMHKDGKLPSWEEEKDLPKAKL